MSGNNRVPIAILIGQLGLGGAERQLYYLLNYGNRELFDYHVMVLNSRKPYDYNQAICSLGVQVWQLPESCLGILRRTYYLYRLLRQIRPRIIHSWSFYANPYAALTGFLAGVQIRLGSLRNEPFSPFTLELHPFYRWLAYRSVSELVVNTKLAADQLEEMGYPIEQVSLIYNGVELPDLSSPSSGSTVDLSAYGIGPEHRVVATVGNLRGNKNQEMFIEAMARVLPQFRDVRCLVVGRPMPDEPSMYDQLENRVHQLGLSDKIHLTGIHEDVPQLMRRFAIFCLTSCSEGMPNVVLEAMAAACPVVATRVGDVPEVIKDGENGFLVDSEDAEGLAQVVARLLRDAELAERVGAAGRATVEQRFSCQRMAQEIEQVYLRALVEKCPEFAGQRGRPTTQ